MAGRRSIPGRFCRPATQRLPRRSFRPSSSGCANSSAIRENEGVDLPLFDESAYQSEGGFSRIDKIFEGKLSEFVAELQDRVWQTA